MKDENKNISEVDKDALIYQLKRFEVLIKRKAGQYCLLDWKRRLVIASGEQKKSGVDLVAKNKKTKEVISWLKEFNKCLQKEDFGNHEVLLKITDI